MIQYNSTKRRSVPVIILIGFMIVVSTISSIIMSAEQASAAMWDGRSPGRGYFSNGSYFSLTNYKPKAKATENHVLPNYPGDSIAIPYSIDTVAELVAMLKGYNSDGADITQKRRYAGSGFIAHTMLGHAPGSVSRSVSSAEWDDLTTRLNGASINWNVSTNTDGINTYAVYGGGNVDIVYEGATKDDVAIVITTANGSYKLFRRCANPVGNPAGLAQFNFNLTPVMSADTSITEGSTKAHIEPSMDNAGPTASKSVDWRVTRFRVEPGGTVPKADTNTTAPLTYFANGTLDVANVPASRSPSAFAKGTASGTSFPMSAAEKTVELGDYKVGTKICFALSVAPYSHTVSASSWRHSAPYCIVFAKSPKVQILGNDLFVGKGRSSIIATSTTTKTVSNKAKVYGSWGEYALAASGAITGMASGAAYNGGAISSSLCNLLTFTNEGVATNCADGKGNYSAPSALPSIGSRFITTKDSLGKNPAPFNIKDLDKGVYTATGNVTLEGSATIGAKKWIVLNMPDADVRIKDNIRYTDDELQAASDIPQVVIIANSITIDASVTSIDAWLVAEGSDGTIDTCREVVSWTDLNSDKCDKRLTVNGPVIAKHLILQRTAGSGTGDESGDPAEVFNLRPDAYLWATAWSAGAGRLQTVFSKELPPRF